MDLYREHILDHYENPRNFGKLARHDRTAEVFNDFCGDRIAIFINLHEKPGKSDQQIVHEISFEGEGCAISMASASILTEFAKGKAVVELQRLKSHDIVSLLGVELTPVRLKCALLSWEVLQKALAQ